MSCSFLVSQGQAASCSFLDLHALRGTEGPRLFCVSLIHHLCTQCVVDPCIKILGMVTWVSSFTYTTLHKEGGFLFL